MSQGTVSIHGKTYLTVAKRVNDFRAKCPIDEGWGIITHLVQCSDQVVVMRAEILHPTGDVIATGWAEEVRTSRGINQNAALENCETSAIGRALAAAGYGGSEYATADEVAQKLKKRKVLHAEAIVEPDHYVNWCAELVKRMVSLEDVVKLATVKQWGVPRRWSIKKRDKFLAALDAGEIEELS